MKLGTKSQQKLESFFREHYGNDNFNLPPVYFYIGGFTKVFTGLIQVQGITLGKRIYIFPEIVQKTAKDEPKLPERLAAHEIAHVLQYQKYGITKFFFHYLRCFWKNLKTQEKWDLMSRQQAYLDIPFEIEAREIEQSFVNWCKNLKSENAKKLNSK
jgi:hypothetical protein